MTSQDTDAIKSARITEIKNRLNHMQEYFSGCDWCCGGGDEEWAELQKELSDLEGVSVNSWALKLGEELDAMKEMRE